MELNIASIMVLLIAYVEKKYLLTSWFGKVLERTETASTSRFWSPNSGKMIAPLAI